MSNNVDNTELNKFSNLADAWWDINGALKTLHDINQIRSDYIEKFLLLENKKLLDIGCGGGILSESMAKRSAIVTGIDPESSAIEIAKKHAEMSKLEIKYHCTTVEDLKTDKYNVITCLEMLEHVPNPESIIANAKRLLVPGGYLFLSTINRTVKSYLQVILAAEYILNLLPRQTHDFTKFIKPSELCAVLRSHSFQLIDITGMSYNPLTRKASLTNSIDVNYILTCRLDN